MKKAQAAIYYSMGDPTYINPIVKQTLRTEQMVKDPVLKCLVGIELMVQQTAYGLQDYQQAIEKAAYLIKTASEIVELFTNETGND